MATKQCSNCGLSKSLDRFKTSKTCTDGYYGQCKDCQNSAQRVYRKKVNNLSTLIYEKTKRGFLMRAYRNMQSRIEGVQYHKWHLYAGKELLPRDEFVKWALASPEFSALFDAWELAGYPRKATPSVDRKDPLVGYRLENMEWVTHSENSRRGSHSRHYGRAA